MGDLADEHERWRIHRRAIEVPRARELLKEAVSGEPDAAVASSVVLPILELVPEEQHADWMERLESRGRSYARRRSAEIGVLRRARRGDLAADEIAAGLDGWSDWLQLRLTEGLPGADALALVAERGRTRRVRGIARNRRAGGG
ncbi:hypothetical protein [Bailinhaonella thermotolerans]|uniref:hypothetical protein n=1 Tax=Bailinhaonella thermotolerans TaxID=1070861 RepID=UPI0011C46A20|nr:hypothetical protein [Bailinhaonella thermotolerans]